METKTIYTALLTAQKSIETITKDATANAGSFKYSYATLGQVMDMVKKPLNDNGIIITQPITGDRVVTILTYIDGTSIQDTGTPIICARPNDPQAQGSAISYARRYGLMSLLCLSAEDDDGVKAMPHASPAPQGQTITPTQSTSTTSNKIYTFSLQDKDHDLATAMCDECHSHMYFNEGTSKTGKHYSNLKCELNKEHIVWYPTKEKASNWAKLNELPDIVINPEDLESLPF